MLLWQPAFDVAFSTTGRFTAVLYLQPDDDGSLLALMNRLYEAFPDYPPYGGIHEDNVIPHLTIIDAAREGGFGAVAEGGRGGRPSPAANQHRGA